MQLPPHVQEKFEEEIRVELIRQQTEEELRTNPLYQEFFTQFNQSSVETFIRNYARRKAVYLTRGPLYLNQQEEGGLKYKMFAEEALWAIQQKKLFNLQCQWRAEQVKLKGMEHSTQFLLFAANIQHCPFISPVSRAEVELYMRFLRSGYAKNIYGFDNWQDYEAFKAEYHAGTIPGIDNCIEEHMPSWYRFFDEHMGTARLMDLDDTRGEKENRYRSIARQKQLENIRKQSVVKTKDNRPYISIFDTDLVNNFVKKFEDKHTLKYCRAVEDFQNQMDDHMELDEALEALRSAGVPIAIKSNEDWKEGIVEAARQYEMEQVAQTIPSVHQEYLFRLENGINFPQSIADKKKEEYAFQLCESARQQILEGRRTLGESEDLRF